MLEQALAGARSEGRLELLETEAMAVAESLGIAFPRHAIAQRPRDVESQLARLEGDRVVVKALAPGLIHKTDAGLVRVVPREEAAAAAADLAGAVADLRGLLLTEFIPHPEGPGFELLVGVRRTPDFGPVITVGLGGVWADLLTAVPPIVFIDDAAGAVAGARLGSLLTDGHRGLPPPVERDRLVAFLDELGSRLVLLPDDVAEVECNPVVFVSGVAIALDAAARLAPRPAAAPPRPLDKMHHLLEPSSIALIGVSESMNPGRIILDNVLRAGFDPDRVVVVKPGLDGIAGCRCVPDLGALDPVDLLVLSVAAPQVPGLMDEVVSRRLAEAVILVPGGIGEREGSETLADAVSAAIASSRTAPWRGPLVNGGNSMGITSVPGEYDTLFIPADRLATEAQDALPVAVVSQSGAFAIARLGRLPWLRPRYLVTLGNQIDLTVGDFVTHLAGEPEVDVVACYVEGFRPGDGLRFLEGARAVAARGGTVVLYHAGRTGEGARAAAFHTAAVAGDHAVAGALASRSGVVVADSLEDFEDLVMLATLLRNRRVEGPGLGAVSNAGFECVAMADGATGFRLAPFADATESALAGILAAAGVDGIVGVSNPLDLTPMADDAAFADAVLAVLADPSVDVGVVGCVPMTPALGMLAGQIEDPRSLVVRLGEVWARTDSAWVVVVDGGPIYDAAAAELLRRGIPVFRRADRALRSLAAYCSSRLGRHGA